MSKGKIQSEILAAVPFRREHIARVARWMSRDPFELFMTSSGLTFPVTPKRLERHWKENASAGRHEFFAVFHRATGRHIGHFEIKDIRAAHGTGTLSNVLLGDPEFRGRGLGKELCRLMALCAFRKARLRRLGLAVHTVNRAAVAAYVMGGFQFEGVIREPLLFRGRRYSLYQMSLLRSDRPVVP